MSARTGGRWPRRDRAELFTRWVSSGVNVRLRPAAGAPEREAE